MTTKAETLREAAQDVIKVWYETQFSFGSFMELALNNLSAALAPSIEGQAGGGVSKEWSLACALAGAELNYRNSYEQRGPDHIETGRRWDKMRHAGDAIREHEPAAISPHQRATGELIGWRYARKSWNGKLWRRVDVKPDFETPEDWILEPLYAIPNVSADRAADPDAMSDARCLDDMRLASNVRAAVIRECAKVADQYGEEHSKRTPHEYLSGLMDAVSDIAERIRALGSVSGNERSPKEGK